MSAIEILLRLASMEISEGVRRVGGLPKIGPLSTFPRLRETTAELETTSRKRERRYRCEN